MAQHLLSLLVLMLCALTVKADKCTDNLNRCARVRDQTIFRYEIDNMPVHQWIANLVLIDPIKASSICRNVRGYISTMTCLRTRLTEYDCWNNNKYYWGDRYIPDDKTLKESMDIFCASERRQEKVNLVNCMLVNAREFKKKDACLREEEASSLTRYGDTVNDRSMCSFFHKRMNCYRIYFGAICKTIASGQISNQQQQPIYTGKTITMDEYFDPLRKSSICNFIDGAASVTAGVMLTLVCLLLQLVL